MFTWSEPFCSVNRPECCKSGRSIGERRGEKDLMGTLFEVGKTLITLINIYRDNMITS
jgi:hypothetical protein